MYSTRYITLLLLVLVSTFGFLYSQNDASFSSQQIQNLIDADSLGKAEKNLKIQKEFYLKNKQYDSLSNLIYFFGKIALLKGDNNFLDKSKKELDDLLSLTNNADVRYNIYSDMASLTVENGLNEASYNYNKLGLEAAKEVTEDRLSKMSRRTYGLASTAYFMRKFDLVKKHGIEAFKINEQNPKASATNIYSACNIVGLMMQNENKLDSALYYYNKGVKALESAGGNLSERYYYPAVLSGNTAVIYMNQGKYRASLRNQQEAIVNYKIFMDSSANHPSIINIRYNYLSTINDMGSNYVKLGEIERALQLFEFNYNKAKEYFPKNSIQELVFTNQFAQGKWVNHESEDALKLIDEAYEKFINLSKNYAGYMTYSMGTKANILENMGRIEEAREAYKLSDSLYEMVSPGSYSFDRLTKLREAAMFYSRNGYINDAKLSSEKVLNVAKATEEDENLETIKAYTLLATVKLNQKNYQESIEWANRSLTAITNKSQSDELNQAFLGNLKIEAQFVKTQATYFTIDTTNIESLSSIYEALNNTISLLNQNASKYTSDLDRNEYIFNTKSQLDFSMQIALKLYELTNDEQYLNQVISIHESRIYNRIRSKLGNRDDIIFNDIPEGIAEREKQLKDDLANLRSNTKINVQTLKDFSVKNDEWISFLDSLKTSYPKYYKMRYETIKQSLSNIEENIPKETTVVRYFFVENDLYAFVTNTNETSLHQLNTKHLTKTIESISSYALNEAETCNVWHNLYVQLWKPIASKVKTAKVIIIPDKELFNLSFESFASKKVRSYSDLVKYSLLNEHTISYNYSLQLLEKSKKIINYDKDFIAFAPEFNEEMKNDYKLGVSDSINLDKTYLTLLPQPFAKDIAQQYSKIFNGTFFKNQNASKQVFTKEAKEHKIIHIGTHAESNNISPELSRLIFAKPLKAKGNIENNYLYTYEIYNQNLASNLAILTACETGKPSYQPGEGMISLAHAFNYAGSESILTSLWKIDEQSSAKILGYFYKNIKEGFTKDEALRQAKLSYIASADGRTMAPQYWAGLVLIGDSSSIELSSNTFLYWIIGAVFLVLTFIFFSLRSRSKS